MKPIRILTALSLVAYTLPASAEGLPQMDQSWYGNQLLWLGVSFFALYVIVAGVIAPRISGILATRESAIDESIREAEKAKSLAESTRSQYESQGQNVRAKAVELMAQVQAQNSAAAAEALAKLDHELSRKLAQAEERIADAKAKALAGIEPAAANLAQAMSEKLLGQSVGAEEAKSAVALSKKAA